jgi:hypothetical protein
MEMSASVERSLLQEVQLQSREHLQKVIYVGTKIQQKATISDGFVLVQVIGYRLAQLITNNIDLTL